MKLKLFDKTLLETIRNGKNDLKEIIKEFNIDENEFAKRLKSLKKNKLVVESEGKLKLGINGFDEIEKDRKQKERKKKKDAEKQEKKQEILKPIESELKEEPKEVIQKKLEVNKIEVVEEGKIEKMDLNEIVKKYGPTEEQKKTFEKKMEVIKAIENDEKKSGNEKKVERCALCRQPFELSMKDNSKARYGYCFCGAAYHKDCYESLLDASGLCVNCGKKLVLILDKQTKDALKNVKNLF
jgi:isoleucyl-tRNA synthetase